MKIINKANHNLVAFTISFCFLLFCDLCLCSQWDHIVDFDNNYRLLWTSNSQDITFEIQAKTLGYVGLGFSNDGTLTKADVAIGWIDQGHAWFQDRHIKLNGDGEPIVDPSQDYVMLLGYENVTHTVLRFKRKLDTCDTNYDLPITNDTMRVIFMYSDEEPKKGSTLPGTLPNPLEAFKGSKSLFLTQRSNQNTIPNSNINILELKNEDVELPQGDDTLYWCKVFKLNDFNRKHHLVRYEPVFDSATSVQYLNHIILYECQGATQELEKISREQGRPCHDNPNLHCNAIVANWARGSEGFTFPQETGYPLDSHQASYYLMETHYNNPDYTYDFSSFYQKNLNNQQKNVNINGNQNSNAGGGEDEDNNNNEDEEDDEINDGDVNEPQMVDNSGLKLFYTQVLRKFDAGVLSIGMDPNWRHIIPPGQDRVESEGHCIGECTRQGFRKTGINIFAVMTRTHLIGKQVRLRQIRGDEELQPIVHDTNVDPSYQEYRRLPTPVKALPGDSLVAECIYDSSSRKSITLGGMTSREEICLIFTLYYPRQKELTACHSLPSLPTVLHSLGIQQLAIGTNPVLIASPPELSGMTLEKRLVTYDWANQFESFQQVTQKGSFKPLCWSAKMTMIPGTENIEVFSPNITKSWKPANKCSNTITNYVTETEPNMIDMPAMDDHESNNIIEGDLKTKVSRSSTSTKTMGLSSADHIKISNSACLAITLIAITVIRLF